MTEAARLKDPAFLQLKSIQSERLSRTYADFMDQPIYEPTCRFFFGEVYTANDTSARDAAFAAFTAKLKRALGGDIVETLEMLVQLQALTVELDLLVFDAWQSMADQPSLTNDVYE